MQNQPMQLTLKEALAHLRKQGKSAEMVGKAVGVKNKSYLSKAASVGVKKISAKTALNFLDLYDILLYPYTSRLELESIVDFEENNK